MKLNIKLLIMSLPNAVVCMCVGFLLPGIGISTTPIWYSIWAVITLGVLFTLLILCLYDEYNSTGIK